MAFLNQIDQLRKIEWSKSYLWDIKFDKAPSPFNEWFPATEVTENTSNLNSLPIEGGNAGFKIPQSKASLDLTVTFIDDINNTLYLWIRNWIDSITQGHIVATLAECTSMVNVAKLDSNRNVLSVEDYIVYPEGNISYASNSNSDTRQYTISFVVVGRPGNKPNSIVSQNSSLLGADSTPLLPPLVSKAISLPSASKQIESLKSNPSIPSLDSLRNQVSNIVDVSKAAKAVNDAKSVMNQAQSLQKQIDNVLKDN